MKEGLIIRIQAGAVRDAAGVSARPGALLVQAGRILAAGADDDVPTQADRHVDWRDRLVMPAMVNAHAHLELSSIGPQPYTGDFVSWVRMLRDHWPGDGPAWSKRAEACSDWFTAAARAGAAASAAAGVGVVGDIARTAATVQAARERGLVVRGYLELFGVGEPWDEPALAMIDAGPGQDNGWQPHAPYSAGPRLFDAAARSGRPVCTHLAETLDEARFVAHADGPFRDLLEQLGKWRDAHAAAYGDGRSPVQWLAPFLRQAPWLVAHCNYLSDDDIVLLASTRTSVAYCPIASEYFGHAGHRYRDLLAAGVNVCLGTDSVVCQPSTEPQPMAILPQMRRLYRRDGADAATLLAMATTHGMRALQWPPRDATLAPGAPARFAVVRINPDDPADPLLQALAGDEPCEGPSLPHDRSDPD